MNIFKKIQLKIEPSAHIATRLLLAVLVFIFGTVIAINIHVRTASAGPGDPFGGLITYVFVCTCSANFAIYFNDLTITSTTGGLPLIYQPGVTITYPFGPPLSVGQWMLGTWQSGGSCIYYVGKGCTTLPTAGTMYMVGTSM